MATVKPAKNGRFAKYISSQSDDIKELPLLHISPCESVLEIAKTSRLEPRRCRVFRKPLVYFFYGRPAYQSKFGKKPTSEIRFFPVCFVFKPYLAWPKIGGVYPFDTGGAALGKFRRQISRAQFRHYQLESSIKSAQRVVKHFFETNDAYYAASASRNLSFSKGEEEAQRYYALINTEGETTDDDRRSTIEIQFRDRIVLRDRLLTVILPRGFLQSPEICKAVYKDWRVYPLTYRTWNGAIPSASKNTIFELLQVFLEKGEYL